MITSCRLSQNVHPLMWSKCAGTCAQLMFARKLQVNSCESTGGEHKQLLTEVVGSPVCHLL